MKYSYNWLQSYFSKKLPPAQKLADLITSKAFEVEEVKKFKKDWVLDISVLPDRFKDANSHLGMAREISALTGLKFNEPKIKIKESREETKKKIKIEIKEKEACPLYVSKIIEGVRVGPSPKWLIERLEACGLGSINNIVDATNYIMLETGQPLHCFDLEKIADKKIIVRFAKDGEEIETLDDKKIKLNKSVLLIADKEKPLAIAGIKGGLSSGVDKNTKRIAIESASFHPALIRRASLSINLMTDASIRFTKGVDSNFSRHAAERLTTLIQELAGGQATKGISSDGQPSPCLKSIKFDLKKFEQFSGFKIPLAKIKSTLVSLGFSAEGGFASGEKIRVQIPTWRSDIEWPANIYEEILRVFGYDNVPEKTPLGMITPTDKNEKNIWQRKIRRIVASLGYNEVYSYAFVSEDDLNKFELSPEKNLKIENPISSEFEYLRPTQIINLLKITGGNLRFFDTAKIFEIGQAFQKAPFGPVEETRLTGVLTNKDKKANIFLQAKGSITRLFQSLGIWGIEFVEPKENVPWLTKGRIAEIRVGKNQLGFLAQISQKTSEQYLGGHPAVVFDMSTDLIINSAQEEKEFISPSKYPTVIRDLSILVGIFTKISAILSEINVVENKILVDVDLFDIYEGEKIDGDNRKSLSFHFIFQASDRTLSSEEVDKAMEKITARLKHKFAAEIR